MAVPVNSLKIILPKARWYVHYIILSAQTCHHVSYYEIMIRIMKDIRHCYKTMGWFL